MYLFTVFIYLNTHLVQLHKSLVHIREHPGVLAASPLQLLAPLLLLILLFGLRGETVRAVSAYYTRAKQAGQKP